MATLGAGQESTVFNTIVTGIAGRDVWLCVVLGIGVGLLAMGLWIVLMRQFPGQGIDTMAEATLGPLRWPFLLAIVAVLTGYAALSGRAFTSLSAMIFPTTPPPFFVTPLVGLAVLAGFLGLQPTARVNQILLLYVDIPAGILLSLLLTGQQRMTRLLPLLAHGWGPVLSGSLIMVGLFSQLSMVLILAPNTTDLKRLKPALLTCVAMVGAMALGHNTGPILQFGDLAKEMSWPDFAQLRLIQVGRDIQRLDVFAVVLWVHGYWILLTLNLKSSALLLKRLFRQPSDRWFLVALGAAAWLGAPLSAASQPVLLREVQAVNQWLFPSLGIGFPLMVLGLARLMGKRGRPAQHTTKISP
ncbi:GerAB/ArcD/ProY family transporter [Sulfobacillus harzensis]|uniref:GerAB/ArcD/ProY family transporter n=1 Tax=Sulfobacillus harzensis TaxID=2729629 RepID=A0A7Y0Q3A6_9FIRM|nr:GerAB/ArcD/ProY family transporter [Sulfobacillus harzensis]NMP23195.1 GerAB/ArcD/ProY family transporter [Sulfobacillus harzensis]